MGQVTVGGAGPWPADAVELGRAMRALRGRTGLRAFADRLYARAARVPGGDDGGGTSKSALGRYEAGKLPPLPVADVLDWAYGADGWLEHAIARLWTREWDPWRQAGAWPSETHEHRWPAHWSGLVWVDLRPVREHADVVHAVTLHWGAWRREQRLALPAGGTVLLTGKAPDHDGVSRDLNLDCDLPVFALFGAGPLPEDDRVVDIRRGWVRDEPPGPEDEHGPARTDPDA